MRTTLRSLAISSLWLLLVAVAEARTRPHYGGTVRVESSSTTNAVGLVTESLTAVDATGRAQPLLATRWESQNGARRWEFWLRPNVRFHDGKVLTAADVVQALNAKGGAPWRTLRADGAAVVFECDDAQPLLPAVLALPEFAIARTDSAGAMVGTGPFRMNGAAGATTKLIAFDDYWQGRAYLDSVELASNRGVREQWMDLSVARADIVDVPAELIRRAQQERMRMLASQNIELIALVASENSQLLHDTRMPQAVSLAIDRNALLNVIFQKQGEVASGILPNWMTGYDFLFTITQNREAARDLHDQARQSGTITIGYEPGDGIQQLLADRVVLNARDAGIATQSIPRNGSGEADLRLIRISLASPNPGVELWQLTSSVLRENANAAESDPEALFRDERDLLNGYRVIPLLYVPRGSAASQRIRNWTLNVNGTSALTEMWVEDHR